jgi:hypothetical protein
LDGSLLLIFLNSLQKYKKKAKKRYNREIIQFEYFFADKFIMALVCMGKSSLFPRKKLFYPKKIVYGRSSIFSTLREY